MFNRGRRKHCRRVTFFDFLPEFAGWPVGRHEPLTAASLMSSYHFVQRLPQAAGGEHAQGLWLCAGLPAGNQSTHR
jgi:hypothetical protein